MAKRLVGGYVSHPRNGLDTQKIVIPVAKDLLKTKGTPIREAEVSFYSREAPLESFSVEQSASIQWAKDVRDQASPETSELHQEFQQEILPHVEWIKSTGGFKPTGIATGADEGVAIASKAKSLGYGAVGFAPFDRRYIYSSRRKHVRGDLPNAICLAMEQDYRETQTIPSIEAERAQGEAYKIQAEKSKELVDFILSIGYSAQVSGPTWHFGPVIPMFVQAGLGQLGVNGQLLSPLFGSRARLQLIITDAKLTHDEPLDYGIYKFCELCQVCFTRCPGRAIQAQRVWYRGVEKNKLIHKRCRPVMARYSGCGICMKVCPIQKYGMQHVMEHYIETGEVLGKGTDNLEGYALHDKGYFGPGVLPTFSTEFFDMPTGTVEDKLIMELKNSLDDSVEPTALDKEKVWTEFRARVDEMMKKRRLVVDMGMDIEE